MARTKKMATAGSSLSGRVTVGVAITAAVIGVAMLACALTGMPSFITLIAAFANVIGIVMYFVAAAKLVRTMGPNNETGIRIVKLTRRLACCMFCSVILGVLYTFIVVGSTSVFILGFVTVNVLNPMSYSAFHILIFSFVKQSFARDKAKAKSRKRKAKRSNASVAPSTSFSVEGEGTGTGGGGTSGGTGAGN